MDSCTPVRSALITGAASGIGAKTAMQLAADGVRRFLLLDCASDGLTQVRDEMHCHWPDIHTEVCSLNLALHDGVKALLLPHLRAMQRLDVLINSAGVSHVNEPEDMMTWQHVMDVNLHGTYRVIQACLPYMGAGGRIINLASVLGRTGHARNTAYCTSKHALVGLTKALALDLRPVNITVNAVLPCSVDTPMYRHELAMEARRAGMSAEAFESLALNHLPMRRFVHPDEVGQLIAFLASPEAAQITGQDYMIDGGQAWGI